MLIEHRIGDVTVTITQPDNTPAPYITLHYHSSNRTAREQHQAADALGISLAPVTEFSDTRFLTGGGHPPDGPGCVAHVFLPAGESEAAA